MPLHFAFPKTASRKKFFCRASAAGGNRPQSRAASRVWSRRRQTRVGVICYADHLGTPRAITRPSDNQVVWKWDNADPFGANAPNENPSALGAFTYNLRFPGQYYDQETGTHYNHHRDFEPATGRYVQSDPIGLAGGNNTYRYSSNNPLIFFDRLGLCDTTMKTKYIWEDAGGREEIIGTITTPPFPIYTWEAAPEPTLNPFDEGGGLRKSPVTLGICSKLKGYYSWKIQMYRNISFKQKFKYVQFCNECNCGPSGCTDWIKGDPVDIREKSAFPLMRKDRLFTEVNDMPCVQFSTPSRGGPGL